MANEITKIHESEYNEILLRCVAVINNARKMLAQQVASIASNTYWEIGKLLHERKLDSKHGSNIVKRLSMDLKEQFPDMGTSPRQLWNMKAFYERYKDSPPKVLRSVALLPWKHNLLLINKKLDDDAVVFYAEEDIATLSNGINFGKTAYSKGIWVYVFPSKAFSNLLRERSLSILIQHLLSNLKSDSSPKHVTVCFQS